MEVKVTIMSGAGNIFSVIDNRKYKFSSIQLSSLAPYICSHSFIKRKTEGLIVIDNPNDDSEVDFHALFFNPDGTSGMMCGNGGRCAVLYSLKYNIIQRHSPFISFSFANKLFFAEINDDLISIQFPLPISIERNRKVNLRNFNVVGDFIDVSSPHFIVFFETLPEAKKANFHTFDLVSIGSEIRFHKEFEPQGTNVDFIKLDGDKVFIRTYERGVENETGSCGTGALSVGFDLFYRKILNFPIRIIPTSGEELIIDAKFENNVIKNLLLIGRAEVLNANTIKIEPNYVLPFKR